ncbi:unnamed protein product, partial [Linum tenue]
QTPKPKKRKRGKNEKQRNHETGEAQAGKFTRNTNAKRGNLYIFNKPMRDTTTETATKAPETGREKPAPVTSDGEGAGAISWAETRAAIDATSRTMERAAAFEKLTWAIVASLEKRNEERKFESFWAGGDSERREVMVEL